MSIFQLFVAILIGIFVAVMVLAIIDLFVEIVRWWKNRP